MNLIFLNPLFLIGLVSALLPVLIHRLTKRKTIKIRFSAVKLLLKSREAVSRPERLKNFILLILRVMIIIGIVFLTAQPVLVESGIFSSKDEPKVLILDNSLSMGFEEYGVTRFDQAKRLIKEIIQKQSGQVVIIPTYINLGIKSKDLSWLSREEALKEVDTIGVSFGPGNPLRCLKLGIQKLKEIGMGGEILFISDMAIGDWKGFDISQIGVLPSDIKVTFLRIGTERTDPNSSIKALKWLEGDAVVGNKAKIEFVVMNFSDKESKILTELYIKGVKRDEKTVELRSRQEGRIPFELSFDKSGFIDGKIKISSDPLVLDDTFYFSIKVREKIRILIVDGDPRISMRESESYYLVNALNPGGDENSPFKLKVVSEEDFQTVDPRQFDAFFLLNLIKLPEEKLSSISSLGKPIFIFLGNRVNPNEYNTIPFFPWKIGELIVKEKAVIKEIDIIHRALKFFEGHQGESLFRSSFNHYFKIYGGKGLILFEDGTPLLLEADIEKGKIYLFSSTADLDWNDLPIKASYLPLIQGLLRDSLGLSNDYFILKSIRYDDNPDNLLNLIQVDGEPNGPGIYSLITSKGEDRKIINTPFEESDLSKFTPKEIKKLFDRFETQLIEYKEGMSGNLYNERKDLWPWLLFLVLLMLGIEMIVSNRIPKRE